MRRLMLLLAAAAMFPATPTAHADLGDQLFKLLPDDGAVGDGFGWSVAISGTIAIVGAVGHGDNGSQSGAAYLFDTNTGKQIAELLPDDGHSQQHFGTSVAISGTTVIVGAHGSSGSIGSAYLFDTTTLQQTAKLQAEDGAYGNRFGFSVGISGTTAIVGAEGASDNGIDSGSAYLFDTTTGQQIAELLPEDGAEFDNFGHSVAISGTIAIIGAPYDQSRHSFHGSAYLFDTTTGQQIAKLLPDNLAVSAQFGFAVAISGTTAIIGAPNDNSAYLFDTASAQQIAKLLADDGALIDEFGISVAISGTTAIIGAPGDDENGGTHAGSAYLFDTAASQQIAKLLADDDSPAGDRFGVSVAISGTTAISGARLDVSSGSAYLFDAHYCPRDLDGDGSVGAADLAELLGSWGACDGCPADFNGDGEVGPFDLASLLGSWGPCP